MTSKEQLMSNMSTDLAAALAAYPQKIAALGGYGATVAAITLGTASRKVVGTLVDGGAYMPQVRTADGRRYAVDLATIEAAP